MISALLKGKSDCPCGKAHSCDIQTVVIAPGALRELPGICRDFRKIVLVADGNTYAACGAAARALLGQQVERELIYTAQGLLIPNEEAIAQLQAAVSDSTDCIVGVGSGVINDLCKYVSYLRGLPYCIVATAPSMDGYASVGAAMITGSMKTTFSAHVPTAIIGDVDVLKEAPMRMIQSGFGDIIGKYSALNDWKLAALINGEYFCSYVYQLVADTVRRTEALAGGILTRDPETIRTLMEALVLVGIAMSYVGNSRPASGSEHHLSHYFEIVGILKEEPYLLHGLDVAYATVQTQYLREQLLALEPPLEAGCLHDPARWQASIRSRYDRAAQGVIALQTKCGFYEKDYLQVYRDHWEAIREILREVPSSQHLLALLRTAGLDFGEFEALYGQEKIADSVWFAKDLKDRYSILWIYYLLCYRG